MEQVDTVQLADIRPFGYVLHRIRSRPFWSYPEHRHNRVFEFYYLFSGTLRQVFGEGELVMEKGDLISVDEAEHHSLSGRNFGFYNLILPVEDWERFLDALSLRRDYEQLTGGLRIFRRFSPARQRTMMDDLDQLFFYQRSSYGDLLLKKFLISLISDLTDPPFRRESSLPAWLQSLLEESEGRLDRGITVAGMAELCGRTPEHMARSFRRYLEITPSSWLNSRRLERAARLLEHSNMPILNISLSLGFENLNYFYKLFSRTYGVPPGRYRASRTRIFRGE